MPGIWEFKLVKIEKMAELVAEGAQELSERSDLFAHSGPHPRPDYHSFWSIVTKELSRPVLSRLRRALERARLSGHGSRACSEDHNRDSSSPSLGSGSREGGARMPRAAFPDRVPARIQPRSARRAICADIPRPNRPGPGNVDYRAPAERQPQSHHRLHQRGT